MARSGRVALVAAAGCLVSCLASAQTGQRAVLTVADHLGADQQEETIAVYFAGVLAGTLHVDPSHPDDRFMATVPAMDRLPFTLCGKLVRREADGTTTTHPIDNGGTLAGYEGGVWDATTIGDVLFSLHDETGLGEDTHSAGPACSAAVS